MTHVGHVGRFVFDLTHNRRGTLRSCWNEMALLMRCWVIAVHWRVLTLTSVKWNSISLFIQDNETQSDLNDKWKKNPPTSPCSLIQSSELSEAMSARRRTQNRLHQQNYINKCVCPHKISVNAAVCLPEKCTKNRIRHGACAENSKQRQRTRRIRWRGIGTQVERRHLCGRTKRHITVGSFCHDDDTIVVGGVNTCMFKVEGGVMMSSLMDGKQGNNGIVYRFIPRFEKKKGRWNKLINRIWKWKKVNNKRGMQKWDKFKK